MEMLPLAAAAMMGGTEISAQIVLSLQGNFERNVIRYECDRLEPLSVDYINAHPNFLAILPVKGEKLVFASTIAASGVRYVSGQYEWWTKGGEATLADLAAAEGAEPVICLEVSDIP